jgi:hypothetical protein
MPTVPQTGWQKGVMLGCAAVTGAIVATSLWLFIRNREPEPAMALQSIPAAAVSNDEPVRIPDVETSRVVPPRSDDLVSLKLTSDLPGAAGAFAGNVRDIGDKHRDETARDDQAPASQVALSQSQETVSENSSARLLAEDSSSQEAAAADPAVAAEIIESTHEESAAHPLPAPSPDTTARLNIRLDGVVFPNMALRNVVTILEQITSVPIELDRGGLFRAGVEPRSSVRLELQNATAAEMLQDVVNRWGLAVVPIADRVILTVPTAEEAVLRTGRVDLGQLAPNRTARQQLVEMVKQLVEPASWQPAGKAALQIEGTALRVTQTAVGYRQLQAVLEKLLVARGIASGKQREDSEGALASRTRRAAGDLSRTVSCGSNGQLPLDRYLTRLAHRAGVSIALDELSLLRYGVSPQTVVTAAADEKPLEVLLTEALQPLGLTWRVLDAGLLEVTTPRAVAQTPDIECYTLSGPVNEQASQALLRRIQQEISPHSWSTAGGTGVAVIDPIGRCLLVRQPQPLQRALEAELIQWKVLLDSGF